MLCYFRKPDPLMRFSHPLSASNMVGALQNHWRPTSIAILFGTHANQDQSDLDGPFAPLRLPLSSLMV